MLVRLATIAINVILGLFMLSMIILAVGPSLLGPDQIKDYIADRVREATGRRLSIDGEIDLNFSPGLSLTLEEVSLGDADGFTDEPMARLQRLTLELSLWPLLKGERVADAIHATGLVLRLQRDASGRGNWDDLLDLTEEPVHPLMAPVPTPSALAPASPVAPIVSGMAALSEMASQVIGGIELTGGRLLWRDAVSGDALEADGMIIRTGAVLAGQPLPIHVETDLTWQRHRLSGHVDVDYRFSSGPDGARIHLHDSQLAARLRRDGAALRELDVKLKADLSVNADGAAARLQKNQLALRLWTADPRMREIGLGILGDLDLDLTNGRLHMAGGEVAIDVKGKTLPPAGVALALRTGLILDLFRERLLMKGFQGRGPAQTALRGSLHGQNLFSDPGFQGDLTLSPFDPRALLVAIGQPLPVMGDDTALSRAHGSLTFRADRRGLAISALEMVIDDSLINGNGRLITFDPPLGQFLLRVNRLNFNRYLPPGLFEGGGGAAADGGDSPDVSAVQVLLVPETVLSSLPPEVSKTWDLRGRLHLDSVQLAEVMARDYDLTFRIGDGQLHLDPYRVGLYDGSVRTVAHLDRRGAKPELTVVKTLDKVKSGPLLREALGIDWFSGLGSANLRLQAVGDRLEELRGSSSGTLSIDVTDGRIGGLDVVGRIRASYAAIKGLPVPAPGERRETVFTALRGSGVLTNGRLSNRDLTIDSPVLKVRGGGEVDFAARTLDYGLTADVPASLRGFGGARVTKLKGLTLPMRLKGPFSELHAPTIDNIDFSRMLRSAIDTPLLEKTVRHLGGRERALETMERFRRKLERSSGKGTVDETLKELLGF